MMHRARGAGTIATPRAAPFEYPITKGCATLAGDSQLRSGVIHGGSFLLFEKRGEGSEELDRGGNPQTGFLGDGWSEVFRIVSQQPVGLCGND